MSSTNQKLMIGQLALVLLALAACTKETPYQGQLKEDTLSKAQVNTNDEYLYVESYASVSRSSSDAIPFYMGDEQIVKFRFSKDALEVVALDKEKRFAGNAQNNKIILSVPIEHKAFRCETDRFGECKNKEEENNDIPNMSKDLFKPDFSKMNQVSASVLPADLRKYFNNCYEQKDQRVTNYEFTDEAVNVEIEKTYQLAARCQSPSSEDLRDGSVVSIAYHHSFVKLSKFATPDYKAVSYPEGDQSTFGFFTTDRTTLDTDNRDLEKGKTTYMNRWNPDRSEVVYYLSDEFDKPENAAFKKASHLTFDKMNEGLVKAGAKFKLVLKDPAQKSPGDIRNSMIVLVEDPSGAGLLGYGPVASNPYTGEILSARVVMFSGILKTGLSRTYDEIRQKRLDAKNPVMPLPAPVTAPAVTAPTAPAAPSASLAVSAALKRSLKASLSKPSSRAAVGLLNNKTYLNVSQIADAKKTLLDYKSRSETGYVLRNNKGLQETDVEQNIRYQAGRLAAMSKYCAYPLEYVNFDDQVLKGIESQFPGDMPAWDDLDDAAKNKALDALAPTIFEQVLLHELGHNMGLRHNFQGSEDKDNWYKAGEIAGLTRPIPYSSIMDYTYSETNALPVVGKYDIAALRFGYKRTIEVMKKGTDAAPEYETVAVPTTVDDLKAKSSDLKLKKYGYCTDEHVGANPGCKRFDEGTSLSEIAAHWIRAYNRNYSIRNFRNGMRNFSVMNDSAYVSARFEQFTNLRLMYEAYENIKNKYRIADDDPAWTKEEFLADIKKAAVLSGQFFIDVIKTPDYSCLVEGKDEQGNVIRQILPISKISTRAISCRDTENISLNPAFKIVGELGRFFQSKKSPSSTNPYVDQVDVRGIWGDKLVATEMLFMRQLGSPTFDTYTESFIDVPELRVPLKQMLAEILIDQVTSNVEITDMAGAKRIETQAYGLADTSVINQPLNPRVNLMLGIPDGEQPFSNQLLSRVGELVPSPINRDSAAEFLESFRVYRMPVLEAIPTALASRNGTFEEIDGSRFMALPENVIAAAAIEFHKAARTVGKLNDDGKKLILQMITTKQMIVPEGVPPEVVPLVKEALSLNASTVQMSLAGQLKTEEFYTKLLNQLPARGVH